MYGGRGQKFCPKAKHTSRHNPCRYLKVQDAFQLQQTSRYNIVTNLDYSTKTPANTSQVIAILGLDDLH